MRRIMRLATTAVLGSSLFFGCGTNMMPTERGEPGAARKVLVAGEGSAFKEKVVDALIDDLGTQDWYFRVVGLDGLDKQETAQYGAILLVAAIRAGRFSEGVTKLLERVAGDPRVVLFFTRGSEDPIPDKWNLDLQVDSVSSASRDDRVEKRAAELAALLKARF